MIVECSLSLGETDEELIKEYKRLIELVQSESSAPVFNPNRQDSVILQSEKSQEKMILSLEENGINNAREMTVFQIEVAIEKFEEAMQRLKQQDKDVIE